ncbi:hypothetical protein M3Y94_00288200 [Aphelenchoides besseyi]|nr:hypothetical protein M3Y94_00288200 [Aphelenchoides besseyi]
MHALLVLIPLFGVNLASAVYSTESDWHDIVNMQYAVKPLSSDTLILGLISEIEVLVVVSSFRNKKKTHNQRWFDWHRFDQTAET